MFAMFAVTSTFRGIDKSEKPVSSAFWTDPAMTVCAPIHAEGQMVTHQLAHFLPKQSNCLPLSQPPIHPVSGWLPPFQRSSLSFSSSAHQQRALPLLPLPQLGLSSAQAPLAFSLALGLAWDSVTLSSDGGSETPLGSGRGTKGSVSGGGGREKLELEKNLKSICGTLLFCESVQPEF